MVKYKHIEAARELRLWLSMVIVPTAGALAAFPELREAAKDKYHDVKKKITVKKVK